tara:strand:+ start:594 stop:770 length:177 start_codon:yes stop_codon:yes gene_type:complete
MISKNDKIFLAGHNGMVGSSVLRYLKNKNYKKLLIANRKKLDLTLFNEVNYFLKKKKT